MNNRQRQDLDNYITGHYGEDQLRNQDEVSSAHWAYLMNQPMREVYDYDPADDGPECEVITRILASHPSRYRRLVSVYQWFPMGKRFD